MGRVAHGALRTAVLGGWAVLLAALALGPASPGAAWASDGAGDGEATDGLVRHAPQGTISAPADGAHYVLGQPIALAATASDEDGPLGDEALRWTVVRRTGESAETVATATGPQAAFTPPTDRGLGTSYEIRLDVVDPDGLASSSSVSVVPTPVTITLASIPAGAPITVDGGTAPAPRAIRAVAGQRLQVGAADAFTPAGGSELVLDAWSDGGTPAHELVAGEDDLELTATYRAPQGGIGEALLESSAPASASAATAGIAQAVVAEHRLPALRFDPPNPFGTSRLSGTLRAAPTGGRVEIAVRRGSPRRAGCGWWVARNVRFTRATRPGCGAPRWIPAQMRRTRSGLRWVARLGGALPAGSYAFVVRVLDGDGRPVDFEKA
jgi:hypothetical protein